MLSDNSGMNVSTRWIERGSSSNRHHHAEIIIIHPLRHDVVGIGVILEDEDGDGGWMEDAARVCGGAVARQTLILVYIGARETF